MNNTNNLPREWRYRDDVIKKSRLHAFTNGGYDIYGDFYIEKDVRPSDYLRNPQLDKILLKNPTVNGKEIKEPLLLILSSCQFVLLLDDHVPLEDR